MKPIKRNGIWQNENLSRFKDNGKSIVDQAKDREDEKLLCRIQGYDLAACQAKFHRTCKINYIQNPEKWRSKSEDAKEEQTELEKAHEVAFKEILTEIDEKVIQDKKILKLGDLRELYVNALKATKFPNSDYRNEKLKSKIEKHPKYVNHISFIKLDDRSRKTLFVQQQYAIRRCHTTVLQIRT